MTYHEHTRAEVALIDAQLTRLDAIADQADADHDYNYAIQVVDARRSLFNAALILTAIMEE